MSIAFFLVVAVLVGLMILSERIKDGVIIKAGLICVSVGFMGAASLLYAGESNLIPALHMISTGITFIIFGAAVRGIMTKGQCRRIADWFENPTVTK